MYPHFFANGQAMVHILTRKFSGIGLLLVLLNLTACGWFPAENLAPKYEPSRYVVPDTWHGSPFVEGKPADGELRSDWWKLYGDPVLDKLVEQAIEANPDLQAAAERFVQARNMMMKALAQYLSQVGFAPCVYAISYNYDRRMARQRRKSHEDDIY